MMSKTMPYAIDRRDRAKAMALVIALHIGLGAALVFGLAGGKVRDAAERLATFDIPQPIAPIEEPPPQPLDEGARDDAGAPDLRARPAEVVAPKPVRPLPVPSPVRTSDERAPVSGSDTSAGAAAVRGPGRGAGGSGTGFGGGGTGGDGVGAGGGLSNQARLVGGNRARLPSSFFYEVGVPRGEASLMLTVEPTGRVSMCRVTASSGSGVLDAELCRIMLANSRWEPARDRAGRPVTVQVGYTSTWDR